MYKENDRYLVKSLHLVTAAEPVPLGPEIPPGLRLSGRVLTEGPQGADGSVKILVDSNAAAKQTETQRLAW